jgi:hypothetical protein
VTRHPSRPSHSPDVEDRSAGYEVADLPARGIAYALLGLFGLIALSLAVVAGLLAVLEMPPRVMPFATVAPEPPPPRLEVAPAVHHAALEEAAAARLNGYGWVDRDRGWARIPIERAMSIIAEHGWPGPAGEVAVAPPPGPSPDPPPEPGR